MQLLEAKSYHRGTVRCCIPIVKGLEFRALFGDTLGFTVNWGIVSSHLYYMTPRNSK